MSLSFKQVTADNNNLLIIDAINMGFRWKHSGATDFCDEYIKTIESYKKSYKASHVIVACDKGSSSYRKAIYPEYKQNRKDKQALQTDIEKVAFEVFFEEFEKTMQKIQDTTNYPVIRFQGVEADDVVALIVSKKKSLNINEIWMISTDKDYDLLITEKVSRFSYVTRKEVTHENWANHYDWTQDEYISIKCLMGDTGDNVFGVPSIGPKRAHGLVEEFGSTWDIIASIPLNGKYKYIQELNKCKDRLMLNYQLMDLVTHCEEAVGVDNCKTIDNILEEYIK